MSLIVLTEGMEDISANELERMRYFTARFWRRCVHEIIDQVDQDQKNEIVERDLIQSVAEEMEDISANGLQRMWYSTEEPWSKMEPDIIRSVAEEMEDILANELQRMWYSTEGPWSQMEPEIIQPIAEMEDILTSKSERITPSSRRQLERDLIRPVAEDLSNFLWNDKYGITRLEYIHDIFGSPNRGSDDLKVASILGQGEEEQRELLGNIVKLVNHAPATQETIISMIKRLAKVHIDNLLIARTPDDAYVSSRFAVQALYNLENIKPESLKGFTELSDALSGSTYEDGGKSFNCKLLEEVINFGKTELGVYEETPLDLNTDGESRLCPHTYGQISMALYYDTSRGLLGEDATAARKGLEKAEKPRDKFFLGYRIARACFGSLDAGNGESVDSRVQAIWDNMKNRQDDIEEARGLFFDAVKEVEHIEKDFDLNQYPELKSTINLAYQMMALLEVQLEGYRDNVSETMIAAKRMASPDTRDRYIDYLIQVFGRLGKWNDIIKLIRIIQYPLIESPDGPLHHKSYKYIHRAAIICKNVDDVRRLYEEVDFTAVDESQRNTAKYMLEIQRGLFERSVGRVKAARRSFYRVLDSKCSTAGLRVAAVNLSNIVLRKFHDTKTFEKKQEAKRELEDVIDKVHRMHGFEFTPELSALIVPLAIFQHQFGPARDFLTTAGRSFEACIGALSDNSLSNDSESLLVLARILWLVADGQKYQKNGQGTSDCGERDGYGYSYDDYDEHEAGSEIEEVSEDGENEAERRQGEGDKKCQETMPESILYDVQLALACRFYPVTASGKYGGDGESEMRITCDVCFDDIERVSSSNKAHTCLTCIDFNVCTRCYEARDTDRWIDACPETHKYLTYPPDDFETIEEAELGGNSESTSIKGDPETSAQLYCEPIYNPGTERGLETKVILLKFKEKEVSFEDWRNGLREKWKAACETYSSAHWQPVGGSSYN